MHSSENIAAALASVPSSIPPPRTSGALSSEHLEANRGGTKVDKFQKFLLLNEGA